MRMTGLDLILAITVLYATSMESVNAQNLVSIMMSDDQTLVEGETAKFYCTTDMTERTYWNWKKDNKIIGEERDLRVYVSLIADNMLQLMIAKVQVEDANYNFQCCIKTNEMLVEKCKNLRFPSILEVPHDTYPTCELNKNPAIVGELATVECCCEVINPMPTLTWVGVSSVERNIHDKLECISHTFKVKRDHEKEPMVCEMTTNTTKRIQRNCTSGKIQVLYKPDVKIQGDLPFQKDTEVVLICIAVADPPDRKYHWSFNRPLSNGVLKENGMVIHLKLTPEDEGTVITCEVENRIGKGSANLTVHIGKAGTTQKVPPGQGPSYVNTPPTMTEDSTILAIVGVSLLFVSFVIAAALCYFVLLTPTPRHPLDYTGSIIPQPDIYFEPKDNIVGSSTSTGQRHVGIQVPGGVDSEPVYMEVPGSDKGSQSQYSTSRSVYV
ncbi:irregular chiasm C-roughest protein-like [Anneissia japonica]|uniref:irregular chiasm C-roughest protein-like n=1 Tax=Anneissia japonica TaxID=1529436 RepID=UPI00142595EE|nr:irregular chiasm C-roughest protein-like [Anneissia japonica]XP_033114864.1 irregular chiasm C-roughest protein-like [Anneissia japonica]XP_033114865.1 irregular chiasm C-roughest protein-like [Anneissia japonica]